MIIKTDCLDNSHFHILKTLILESFLFVSSMIFFYHFILYPVGVRIGLFTPDRAFDMVSKSQIAKFKEPSIKLVDLVAHEMLNMTKEATSKVRFNTCWQI